MTSIPSAVLARLFSKPVVIPSDSNPNKAYSVQLDRKGHLYCTCPNWKFQRVRTEERTCKHIKRLTSSMESFAEVASMNVTVKPETLDSHPSYRTTPVKFTPLSETIEVTTRKDFEDML